MLRREVAPKAPTGQVWTACPPGLEKHVQRHNPGEALTSPNNCPDTVAEAFDNAGLDVKDDNLSTLNSMKLQRFASILPSVLDCEVCSASSGRECAQSVALDVIETAFSRRLLSEDSEYITRMLEIHGLGQEQLNAGE